MKKTVFLIICLFILTSCSNNVKILGDYVPYTEIPDNYLLEDAKSDNCVVFEDLDITSGQSVWDDFLLKAKDGTPGMVRLAFYYTLGEPSGYAPELYEEIKDEYPALYLQDLSFDGEKYTLFYIEEGKEYSFKYDFLKKFEGKSESNTAVYSDYTRYVLVNDSGITWEQIEEGMVSSQSDAWIDHKIVYSDLIYKLP